MSSKAPRIQVVRDLDDGWSLPDESPRPASATSAASAPSFPTGAALDDGWVLPPEWEAAFEAQPAPQFARGTGPIAVPAPAAVGALDLNAATAEQLCELPGIGAKRAARILALRERLGGFTTVDELTGVSGIGAKTLEQLRALLVVRSA